MVGAAHLGIGLHFHVSLRHLYLGPTVCYAAEVHGWVDEYVCKWLVLCTQRCDPVFLPLSNNCNEVLGPSVHFGVEWMGRWVDELVNG